jgi:four helix bundle protein
MAAFTRFEEIDAWKLGRELTRRVYAASRSGDFARDFALRDQIRRACISVTSNIAEGFERGTRKDFARFLDIAKASAGEVRSQLYVALDEGYLTPEAFEELSALATDTSRKLGALLRYLRSARPKG